MQPKEQKNHDVLIVHHSPCSDGSVAAAVAGYAIKQHNPNSIKYIPTTYEKYEFLNIGDDLYIKSYGRKAKIDKNTDILIVDFSFKKDQIMMLSERCSSITILDHHTTAQVDLAGEYPDNVSILFDMKRSGAMLAWDELVVGKRRKDVRLDIPYSRMVELVGMRDLWKHKGTPDQKDAEALQLAINSREERFNAESLEQFINDGPEFEALLKEGHSLLRFFDSQVKQAMKNAINITMEDPATGKAKKFAICNAINMLASELGNRLCEEGSDFAIVWSLDSTGAVTASARSIGDNDCISIVRNFGGGGHKNAAGFRANLYEFLDYFGLTKHLKF